MDQQSQVPRLIKGGNGHDKKERCKESRKSNNGALKVKYISSPMMVKTTASQFQSLVQHLTGKNSNVERCMAGSEAAHNAGNDYGFHEIGAGAAAHQETGSSASKGSWFRVSPSDFPAIHHPSHMDWVQNYDQHM